MQDHDGERIPIIEVFKFKGLETGLPFGCAKTQINKICQQLITTMLQCGMKCETKIVYKNIDTG